MPRKAYVQVTAVFDIDGTIIPECIFWEDGTVYNIDRVVSVCRAASLKAGGDGVRYTCKIGNNLTYLFLDDNRWFVEAKA